MTIGIPRALIYWKKPHFWEEFFRTLGLKVILSPETNKEIIEMGVKAADPETCFAQKVYWGHLLHLQGKCDLIFLPRLKANQEKLEYCPKFFGIPDLAKILVHPRTKTGVGIKTPILTETFDERKEKFEKTLERLGKKLNKNKKEIKKATKTAFLKEKELKEKGKEEFFKKIKSQKRKIVLVSHPYNLEDEYVNLKMKEKLEKLGVEPIFIDETPLDKSTVKSQESIVRFHWEFAKEIMEKIGEILKYEITGAIGISSFGCGCDAVVKEFVEKKFKENKIPFLYLMIDEHAGEAGLQTRLEAFIDTL